MNKVVLLLVATALVVAGCTGSGAKSGPTVTRVHTETTTVTAGPSTPTTPGSRSARSSSASPSSARSASPSLPKSSARAGSCNGGRNKVDGPDPWGGCWPGPASTGVPAGTRLTVVNGDQTYSRANQVISSKDIRGCVEVTAPGVTIKNSRITCNGSAVDYSGTSSSGRLTLSDVTISCGSAGGGASGVGEFYVTVIRADISRCENGFDADHDVTVRDSYIHDLFQSDQSHTDGLQSCCGTRLVLEHTVWYAKTGSLDGTSGINVNAQPSSDKRSSNTLIEHNLLAGGAYALYCPKTPTQNYRVISNVFSLTFDPKVASFGPTDSCNTSGISFDGNTYDTGKSVPANS